MTKKTHYHLDSSLNFGKYKGKSIATILSADPSYLVWCNENIDWFELDDNVLTEAIDASFKERMSGYVRKMYEPPYDWLNDENPF